MRTLLVTGGTGDLGAVVVPWLAREYRCVLILRSRESMDRVPRSGNVAVVDSADDVTTYAPLFGIVGLAGAFASGENEATLRGLLDANLLSFTRACDAGLPHLEDGGRIVAVSAAASTRLPPGLPAYNVSKAALNAFVQSLAKDLKSRRITANALLPTALATPPMLASADPATLVPLDRVARWIAILLSDLGTGITGQLIEMDG